MPLIHVELVEGTEKDGPEGTTSPKNCLVRMADGSLQKAIIKRVDEKSLAAEIIGAHLLRHWGLQVPDPFIVRLPNGDFAFGSKEEPYPSLFQYIGMDDEDLTPDVAGDLRARAAALVFSHKQSSVAIAADEAISNFDRHIGNILWNGNSISWIDHEKCFWLSKEEDANRLVNLSGMLSNQEEIKSDSIKSAKLISKRNPPDFTSEFSIHLSKLDYNKVVLNLHSLAERVRRRFPASRGESMELFKGGS